MSISINSITGITQKNLTTNKASKASLQSAPVVSDSFVSSKQKSNVSFGVSPEKAEKAVKPLTKKYLGSLVKAMKKMATGKLDERYEEGIKRAFVRLTDNTPSAQKAQKEVSRAFNYIMTTTPGGNETTKAIEELAPEVATKIVSANNKDTFNVVMEGLKNGVSIKTAKNFLSGYTTPVEKLAK